MPTLHRPAREQVTAAPRPVPAASPGGRRESAPSPAPAPAGSSAQEQRPRPTRPRFPPPPPGGEQMSFEDAPDEE